MLTIVIPTHNEMQNNYLERILCSLIKLSFAEVICVDYKSSDGTIELIKKYPKIRLLNVEARARGERLNIGVNAASHDMIILHHPRSILRPEGIVFLDCNQDSLDWGAFTHRFDQKSIILKFTSWYSNYVRGAFRSIYYLDHCIFVKRELLVKIGGVPLLEIFEDTQLSLNLSKISSPQRLKYFSTTSSIRFKKNGIIKQIILNQYMKILFILGYSHKRLNKQYEKNAPLNSGKVLND